jgi:hypothetical protein
LADLFGSLNDDDSSVVSGKPVAPAPSFSRASFSALFGDVNEDSLFDDIPTSKKPSENETKISNPPTKETPQTEKSLSDKKVDEKSPANTPSSKPAVSSLLFDEELPVKATSSSKSETKSNRFTSLFGDDNDDDASAVLFSRPEVKKASSEVPKETKKTTAALFDDDSDVSLFTAKSPVKSIVTAPFEDKRKSLFGAVDDFIVPTTASVEAPSVKQSTAGFGEEPFALSINSRQLNGEDLPISSSTNTLFDSKPETPLAPPPPVPVGQPESDVSTPVAAPPPIPTVDNSAESSGLQRPLSSKIDMLKASGIKIIMPGATPPSFASSLATRDSSDDFKDSKESVERTKSFEEAATASLNRPTVTGKARRAPSKKAFGSDESSDIFGDNKPTASVSAAPLQKEIPTKDENSFVVQEVKTGAPSAIAAIPRPFFNKAVLDEDSDNSSDGGFDDDKRTKKTTSTKSFPPMFENLSGENTLSTSSSSEQKSMENLSTLNDHSTSKATAKTSLLDDEPFAVYAAPPVGSIKNDLVNIVRENNVKAVPAKSSLFDEEIVFGNSGNVSPLSSGAPVFAAETKPVVAVNEPKKNEPVLTKSGLFDEPLFSSAKSSNVGSSGKSASSRSLFDDDDDDLFSSKKDRKKPSEAPSVKKTSVLFGDDDDDGLFGNKKSSSSSTSSGQSQKRSLFDD